MKYSLSFDIGSTITVTTALITYWKKRENILSGRNVLLHWTSLAKRTATKCYRFDNLWLLNEHYELFVLVPILYKPCHETATKHLSDFIKRPFSSDFFFLVLQNLLGIPDLKMGIHSWLFDFIFFPLHRWHCGISSYIMPFHFLLNWTLLEIFKFRYFFPHWQMSALAWFCVETSFVSIRFGLIYFSGNLTFNVFLSTSNIFHCNWILSVIKHCRKTQVQITGVYKEQYFKTNVFVEKFYFSGCICVYLLFFLRDLPCFPM